jgi:hypothetical protein
MQPRATGPPPVVVMAGRGHGQCVYVRARADREATGRAVAVVFRVGSVIGWRQDERHGLVTRLAACIWECHRAETGLATWVRGRLRQD